MTKAQMAAFALALGAAVSAAGVAAVRAWALRRNLLDSPNERSSHVVPTPRGGGLGLMVGAGVALAAGVAGGFAPGWTLGAFAASAGVAWLGWEDDRRGLSARSRLAVQLALALAWVAWCAWRLAPAPPIWLAPGLAIGGSLAFVFCVLFLAWMTNLHNFMDGIDGLAAAQAAAVGAGAALLSASVPGRDAPPAQAALLGWTASLSAGSIGFVWLAIAAACAGFLAWNWAPAKIFMGDVGSASLGFLIAALATRWEAERPGALALVCVLDAVFIIDATWTLAARALRRQKLSQAHRSHAYQIAARRFGSHAKICAAVVAYDVLVLLPLAWLANAGRLAPLVAFCLGGAPVAAACAWLRAGREIPLRDAA